MKLNNTQIKALAQEVLNKIPEEKNKFSKEQLAKYTKIVSDYTKLQKQIKDLQIKQKVLIDPIYKSGNFKRLYDSDFNDIEVMHNKFISNKVRPTLENIIHKITLETVFETKESLSEFIDNLVKQYSK